MPRRHVPTAPFAKLAEKGFDLMTVSHADSILAQPITEVIGSGGGETKFTPRLRRPLASMAWNKRIFPSTKTVDGVAKCPLEGGGGKADSGVVSSQRA